MGKDDNKKVLSCKAEDNVYLHKDFHGALCYSIKYLDENYGRQATREYLQQVGRSYFAPLSKQLKKKGLSVLENHWNEVFTKEGGIFTISSDNEVLKLQVEQCPAIEHLRKNGQLCTERFCETTVIVNETICAEAGYCASCVYQPGKGTCVQKFWKKD